MSQTILTDKIYEKFKELKSESKEDCVIDKSDLDTSFGVTTLLMKWINKKTEWTRVFRDLEAKRKETYRKTYEFYQTDYPLKLNTKDEYNLFIESDINYVNIMNQCLVVKEILVFIDSVIETLKTKNWEIKTYLEWLKYKSGN